ncbi:hypothetical protein MAM1_0102d05276 [Mucor ambiguus]|uniref:Uncharacterized protein n=1 Tax=Mucor ambiguus TaxID=91626 RepID=A0A0C9M740_9FUNG|nr:hypothetical protein MAM1_0102d05276 [Mucor ambiguus]
MLERQLVLILGIREGHLLANMFHPVCFQLKPIAKLQTLAPRAKVVDMNLLISAVKHSTKLPETNVTAWSTGNNEGISLSNI